MEEHGQAVTESGGVGVAIGEEHRESTRKHGQGEQEQNVGDEHAPHKQGNSKHFLTRAAHLQDCGENVERAGKAAEPGQMEAKDGDVACHAHRAQRRVDGPPNTSADLVTNMMIAIPVMRLTKWVFEAALPCHPLDKPIELRTPRLCPPRSR